MSLSTPIARSTLILWMSLLLALPIATVPDHQPTMMAEVIVRGITLDAAADAVTAVGGTINTSLGIISAVDASVPSGAIRQLTSSPDVVAVTPDARVELHRSKDYDSDADPNSMRSVASSIHATRLWDRGITGEGIGVALIDTGIVPVEGLAGEGQVLYGPDLSFESQNEATRNLDTYGHGTHMASIIMGRDAGVDRSDYSSQSGAFLGIAPDAHLISIKIADAHGATDVSQVIAAIDWVVQHRNDPGMNIRVLNLSFGVHSEQSYVVDPVAYAAQVAWDAGIVVVVAAGNDGDVQPGVTSPAYNPTLLAVGAMDTNDSSMRSKWQPLSFSARTGPDGRAADLLAPGSSIVGLAAPGSYLDITHGKKARIGERFFKGSGTSQAAAIVSGSAALILDGNPDWTPDQVKAALLANAQHLMTSKGFDGSTGTLGIRLNEFRGDDTPPSAVPSTQPSIGGGSIEAARGPFNLTLDGVALSGEVDIFGNPLDSVALAQAEAAHASWTDGTWNGSDWTGTQWNGNQWNGNQWNNDTWAGTQWSGTQWSGTQWSGTQWSGTQWSGTQWSGTQWSGTQWSGTQWSGTVWE